MKNSISKKMNANKTMKVKKPRKANVYKYNGRGVNRVNSIYITQHKKGFGAGGCV